MAIVDLIGGMWVGVPVDHLTVVPSFSTFTLSAANIKLAQVIRIPKTGTLHSVEFSVGAIANNPDNGIRVSFQNLTATGLPDGTQDEYRDITVLTANTWHAPPGPMTNDGTNGGTKRSVTVGDVIAVVIEFPSFVASDSITFNRLSLTSNLATSNIHNYSLTMPAGTWFKTTTPVPLCMALRYDASDYVFLDGLILPINAVNASTYNNGSASDERALRFQVPFDCEIDAIQIRADLDGAADIVLYDSASNALVTCSFTDADFAAGSSAGGWYVFQFPPQAITANTTYRISIKPTSATNITAYDVDVPNATLMDLMSGGAQCYLSTRVDAGAWTDATTKRPWINFRISGVDVSAGGGEHSFLSIG